MKSFKILFFALFATTFSFTSCGDDDEETFTPKPGITTDSIQNGTQKNDTTLATADSIQNGIQKNDTTLATADSIQNGTQKTDTVLIHSFKGSIKVTTSYFSQEYGDNAKLGVYRVKSQILVTFSDAQWGDAVFPDVKMAEGNVSGDGQLKMNYRGELKTYDDAVISGPMMTPSISIPSLMGGTTIDFHDAVMLR